MFGFQYCVDLSIVHPTLDPTIVTQRITECQPTHVAKAGEITANRQPFGRSAELSVWLAPLHQAKRLHSDAEPISEFLKTKLSMLERHADMFRELNKDGEAVLSVGWFSDTNHSATCLDLEVVKKCAQVGLGIELNFYAPSTDDRSQIN